MAARTFILYKTMLSEEIIQLMESLFDPDQRKILMRFFRTGKGQYGEGDEFLGLKVPVTRSIVKEVKLEEITFEEIDKLLRSKWHEVRLCGFLLLVRLAESAAKELKSKSAANKQSTTKGKKKSPKASNLQLPSLDEIVRFYLDHASCANNWDLVDLSTPRIVGLWLMTPTLISPEEKLQTLDTLATSGNLWQQRIAMVSTWWTTRYGDPSYALRYAEMLLNHPHDLMHKAVGWMLREVGKSNPTTPTYKGTKGINLLREFLSQHVHEMPRTALRYAIEKMDEEERKMWMQK